VDQCVFGSCDFFQFLKTPYCFLFFKEVKKYQLLYCCLVYFANGMKFPLLFLHHKKPILKNTKFWHSFYITRNLFPPLNFTTFDPHKIVFVVYSARWCIKYTLGKSGLPYNHLRYLKSLCSNFQISSSCCFWVHLPSRFSTKHPNK